MKIHKFFYSRYNVGSQEKKLHNFSHSDRYLIPLGTFIIISFIILSYWGANQRQRIYNSREYCIAKGCYKKQQETIFFRHLHLFYIYTPFLSLSHVLYSTTFHAFISNQSRVFLFKLFGCIKEGIRIVPILAFPFLFIRIILIPGLLITFHCIYQAQLLDRDIEELSKNRIKRKDTAYNPYCTFSPHIMPLLG